MDSRTFAKQLTAQLARRFPRSTDSTYSYRYETMVQSEDRALFSKIAIVIDCDLEPDVARYLLGNILQAFHARPEFRGTQCGLLLWYGAESDSVRPGRISQVLGKYDALVPTKCVTGTPEALFERCTRLCKEAAQTIFLMRKEKWEAMQAAHFAFSRRSVLVYPAPENLPEEEDRLLTIHGTVSLGLDCKNRVAFTPAFANKCMPEFECFAVGAQFYRRDDKMEKAASYADQMFWVASAAQSVPDSEEAQKATFALCAKIHETGWKYLILVGKIGNNVKTDLRFAIMVPAFGQDASIRGPFTSDSVVLATEASPFNLATSCEALWGLQKGQDVQMVGYHIPGNATTDVPLFTGRGELL